MGAGNNTGGMPFAGHAAGVLFLRHYRSSALLGHFSTHFMHKIHSVPCFLFLDGSDTCTFMGQTRSHFPQDTHLDGSTLMRNRAKYSKRHNYFYFTKKAQ